MMLRTILADKYTPAELVDKLNITVEELFDLLEDYIMDEYKEDGTFEDEWREIEDECDCD